MTLALLTVSSVLFVVAFKYLRVVELSGQALVDSRRAVQLINDASLDDEQKEREVQLLGLAMFAHFGRIIARSAVAVALPTIALGLLVVVDVIDTAGIAYWVYSWTFLVINLVLFGAVYTVYGRA